MALYFHLILSFFQLIIIFNHVNINKKEFKSNQLFKNHHYFFLKISNNSD